MNRRSFLKGLLGLALLPLLPKAAAANNPPVAGAHDLSPHKGVVYRQRATWGREYFVSSNGCDSNIGTPDQPLRSMAEAIRRAGNSDVIYFRGPHDEQRMRLLKG